MGELHVQKGGTAAWWNCCPNATLGVHDYECTLRMPGVTIRYVACSTHVRSGTLGTQLAGDALAGFQQQRTSVAKRQWEQLAAFADEPATTITGRATP